MNKVFEDFLSAALGVALERRCGRVQLQYPRRHLDEADRLRLKPDITWWHAGTCRAVIDAKYKALEVSGIPNADAYQMLAYCIAFGLDSGYLVYAKDTGQELLEHVVRDSEIMIRVRSIDVEREPAEVLSQIHALADEIRDVRARRDSAEPNRSTDSDIRASTPTRRADSEALH
jgi:5-methylcytosine-specific restriction enzyme subunit McrC